MKYLIKQFAKYVIVGVLAFVIDYSILVLLTDFAHINYLISATIAFSVSIVFNYLASMRYIYVHKQNFSRKKEFTLFVALSVVGLLINTSILWALVELAGIDYHFAKLISAVLVSLWNFTSRKTWLDASGLRGVEPES